MEYKSLEGAFVRLEFVGPSKKLAEDFQRPEVLAVTGLKKAPNHSELNGMLRDSDLLVWAIHTDGKTDNIGYAFAVFYDGPPFISIFTYEPAPIEVGKDCLELLVAPFFQITEESALFFYVENPVDEELHTVLVDAGFDLWDDNPTVDNDTVANYILERYTYDAYYGEGDEDGEFDEYDEY